MSRAFTKEDDAGDDVPERPVPSEPNYVTARGLELLRQSGEEIVARRRKMVAAGADIKTLDRDLRYLEARINSAIVVPPGSGNEIRFGARVTYRNQEGQEKTIRIVGQDEARTEPGLLAWTSPLVNQMLGLKVGDSFDSPDIDVPLRYTILSVDYP